MIYEIIDRIGAGGIGAVYRARDHRLGRIVALKLKKPSADGQTSCGVLCSLLMREAQAMGPLAHPNVLWRDGIQRDEDLDRVGIDAA